MKSKKPVVHSEIPPKRLTLLVALLTMIGPFTIDTYLPSFPALEAEFDVSRALLSQSLAFYLAAFGISTLVWGPLSDRLGRRTVVVWTLLLYLLASLGCALAGDYGNFLLFRLLQGVAAGGGLAAGRTMIRDVYSPQDAQRAMSRVMMLFALAPAVAPVIGGWLEDALGWQSVFDFLALYSGLMLVMILLWVPETLPTSMRQSFHPIHVARVYGRTLLHRRFQSLVFMVASYFGGMFLYIAGAPTIIFDFLKLDVHEFGVLFVPLVVGIIFGDFGVDVDDIRYCVKYRPGTVFTTAGCYRYHSADVLYHRCWYCHAAHDGVVTGLLSPQSRRRLGGAGICSDDEQRSDSQRGRSFVGAKSRLVGAGAIIACRYHTSTVALPAEVQSRMTQDLS